MDHIKNKIKIIIGTFIVTLGIAAAALYFTGGYKLITPKQKLITNPSPVETVYKIVDRDEKNNIDIYKRVSPSVVNITNQFIYRDRYQPYLKKGTGSGSIIDNKGHILTNYHVIQDPVELTVTLSNKHQYKAKIVGVDPEDDLAIIKIDASPDELSPIQFGDSDKLDVGQKVLAIGNPFGLERTLTTGIISSLGRTIETGPNVFIDDIIQTDAAINPGNSGGPLLNAEGNMIGINTMIIGPIQGSVGIGFAISSNSVKKVLADLLTLGKVRRPQIGVQGYFLSEIPGLISYLNLPVDNGYVVVEVEQGLSASKAGIRGYQEIISDGRYRGLPVGGDIITAIDGKNIKSRSDVKNFLKTKAEKNLVTLTYVRGTKVHKAKVEVLVR